MSNEVMLDIETLGRKAGCVVLSIGAVLFDPRGNGYLNTYYANIEINSARALGLHEEPDTVNWWAGQPAEAKAALFVNPITIYNALYFFSAWFAAMGASKIWCQGAAFDIPILTEAFARCGIEPPWKFWDVRDTRTLYDVCGFDPKSIKRTGVYHNALDDSIHQVNLVQTAMAMRAKLAAAGVQNG